MKQRLTPQIFLVLFVLPVLCTFVQCKVNRQEQDSSAPASSNENQTNRIGIVYFGPDPGAESCMKGLFDGLKAEGFVEGQNLEVKRAHAQGEIANIPLLLQNFDSLRLDAIVTMTTPCLTAACTTVKNTPVVFTYVYDPVAAGAGKDANDHLPLITGTNSFPPIEETIAMMRKIIPNLEAVGTIYNPSEANSVKVIEVARPIFADAGIKLEEVTINNTSDVYPATQNVASRHIQALWVSGDNTALLAFDGVAGVAANAKLPLFINDPEFTSRGALMAIGIGWYQTGVASAKKLAQVLKGEDPAKIPFTNYVEKKLELNHEVAKSLGITFPPDLIHSRK